MSVQGKLLIFSAPSGSGKTTIVQHLLKKFNQELAFSISACTRNPRVHEIPGRDYYFLSIDEFREKIENEEFAEWEEVYPGSYYGTLRSEITRLWMNGRAVLFDVDVKGGLKLKEIYGSRALAVFVRVTNESEIHRRLSARGTESAESLQRRMDKIRKELTFQDQFDVILVNDHLETALAESEILVRRFLDQDSTVPR